MDEFEKINLVEEAFKSVFSEAVYIETKTVKVGGTSNNIYVPKKYAGCPVTIIIWNRIKEIEEAKSEVQEQEETKDRLIPNETSGGE